MGKLQASNLQTLTIPFLYRLGLLQFCIQVPSTLRLCACWLLVGNGERKKNAEHIQRWR